MFENAEMIRSVSTDFEKNQYIPGWKKLVECLYKEDNKDNKRELHKILSSQLEKMDDAGLLKEMSDAELLELVITCKKVQQAENALGMHRKLAAELSEKAESAMTNKDLVSDCYQYDSLNDLKYYLNKKIRELLSDKESERLTSGIDKCQSFNDLKDYLNKEVYNLLPKNVSKNLTVELNKYNALDDLKIYLNLAAALNDLRKNKYVDCWRTFVNYLSN